MRPSTLIRFPVIFSAFLLAAPAAAADLYKWVDEHGVTNYSNELPAKAKAAKKLTNIEDRLSVYTPDKHLLQAVEASRQKALDDVKSGRYERQLEAEHLARLRSGPSSPTLPQGYDPCLDAANVDLCNNRVYSGLPYSGAPVAVLGRHSRFLPQPQITPGTTAGNVVGFNGFMPGQSAFVPGTLMPATPAFSTTHRGRRR